jgi:hypothetical protein
MQPIDNQTVTVFPGMWRFAVLRFIFLPVLLLSACLPVGTPLPMPTDTSMPTPTETSVPQATVLWFPPTATTTPLPLEIQPTVTARPTPGFGDIIFTDDFTSPGPWRLGMNSVASAALGKSELTIAISGPRAYMTSLRDAPVLGDFYLEITASPNLCRQADEYGLLLRVNSDEDFYRFSLSCDGRVRLDRVVHGKASSPQPWVYSSDVPAGAPSSSRLAVWASGKEMRFFINGGYQFTVNDPLLPTGILGVFARSSGDLAVTVNFSDLVVRQVNK